MLRGTCRVDDRMNEQSIIWHTGLGVIIEVNIEVGMVCTGIMEPRRPACFDRTLFDKVQSG
jgi:hypothetical protein